MNPNINKQQYEDLHQYHQTPDLSASHGKNSNFLQMSSVDGINGLNAYKNYHRNLVASPLGIQTGKGVSKFELLNMSESKMEDDAQ